MEVYAGMILSVLSLAFSAEAKGEKVRSEQGFACRFAYINT